MEKSHRKTVMVIEDDPDMLYMLEKALNHAGYSVIKHQAGADIVSGGLLTPDLYILDKNLPTIDGIAICKFLKVHKETKSIPIIMISGYPVGRKAKEVGVTVFIPKPFNLNLLLEAVEKCVN
ncbi:MAG: response regulator [Nitrososphaeraceae archaeon]